MTSGRRRIFLRATCLPDAARPAGCPSPGAGFSRRGITAGRPHRHPGRSPSQDRGGQGWRRTLSDPHSDYCRWRERRSCPAGWNSRSPHIGHSPGGEHRHASGRTPGVARSPGRGFCPAPPGGPPPRAVQRPFLMEMPQLCNVSKEGQP